MSASGIDVGDLRGLRDALLHRGPDDAGEYVSSDLTAGLGHRRLSIIDLSDRARQPLAGENGDVRVVVNGEFYGFRAQRESLRRAGHVFSSLSDSEIAIHLYEDYGLEFVNHLHGMFGLALLDERRRRLVLVRDPVGKKPVYYSHKSGFFAFSSELRPLSNLARVSRDVDVGALNAYLGVGYVPAPRTILSDVRKLPPGSLAVLHMDSSRLETRRYWTPRRGQSAADLDDEEATQELGRLINGAVEARLESDVPLGVFLSGGLDSSVVAAAAARVSSAPIRTFSIGFNEASHDETPYARAVSEHLGTEHQQFKVSLDDATLVDDLAPHFGEPFADASALPTYLLSKMTRSAVTVAISGDGGDELFAGYNWYPEVAKGVWLHYQRPLAAALAARVGRAAPSRMRGKKRLARLRESPAGQWADRTFIFSEGERGRLLTASARSQIPVPNDPEQTASSYLNRADRPLLAGMQLLDFQRYLPEDVLTKVDRMSMAVALEVRCPLLDVRLCDFAFSLRSDQLVRDGRRKWLLRRLAQDMLPPGFDHWRKHGFSVPVDAWMRGSLGEQTVRRLREDDHLREYVDPEVATDLLERHRSGLSMAGYQLWSLLMLTAWSRTCL